MRVLIFLSVFVIMAWLFDRACLWLERKGYIYYRNLKPQKGIIGSALQELNAQLLPTKRHVIVAQQEQAACKKSVSGSPAEALPTSDKPEN